MHRLTACERSELLSVQGYTRSVLFTEFAACEWAFPDTEPSPAAATSCAEPSAFFTARGLVGSHGPGATGRAAGSGFKLTSESEPLRGTGSLRRPVDSAPGTGTSGVGPGVSDFARPGNKPDLADGMRP